MIQHEPAAEDGDYERSSLLWKPRSGYRLHMMSRCHCPLRRKYRRIELVGDVHLQYHILKIILERKCINIWVFRKGLYEESAGIQQISKIRFIDILFF